jgi:hypothetical protein
MSDCVIEVPYAEVAFPQSCASCGSGPADTTLRVQRAQAAQTRWYFFFGLIGAAIANAARGGQGTVRLDVPYCRACRRRDRTLGWVGWGLVLAGFLFIVGATVIAAGMAQDVAATPVMLAGSALGLLALVAAVVVLAVRASQRALKIRRLHEKIGGARLAFRNPTYYERFRALNLRRLISFALRYNLPLPVEASAAVAALTAEISAAEPDSESALAACFDRGQLHLKAGSYARAVDDLSQVVAVTGFQNPHFVDAHYFRGQAYMQLTRNGDARSDLERFVNASDDRRRVREAKGWLKKLSAGR